MAPARHCQKRIANLELDGASGARFIQPQFCFDIDLFRRIMKAARERVLHRRTRIIAGVGVHLTGRRNEEVLACTNHHTHAA